MQYLVSVIHDQPGLATPDEMAATNGFNDRLQTEGYGVFAGGPASPSTATVIDNRGGEAVSTDRPLDVALKLAAKGSKACNRKIEVRPFL